MSDFDRPRQRCSLPHLADTLLPTIMAARQASHRSAPTTRETIETQIAHHYACIRDLKAQLNTLASISVLPPEVLSHIFLHDADFFGDRVVPAPSMKTRLRITHVCRHWRMVALDCPVLWSRFCVDKYSAMWMEELLSRSRQARLSIALTLSHGTVVKTVQANAVRSALASLGRVRDLSLKVLRPIVPEIGDLLRKPCPVLESLHIILFYAAIPTDSSLDALYNSQHSKLRQLQLSNCPVDWSHISLPNLTDLHIFNGPTPASSAVERPALNAFLGALARMPHLQMLTTNHALGLTTDANESAHTSRVPLPHLWKLQLNSEELPSCTRLLSCLDAPHLSRLQVTIASRYEELHSYSQLFRTISTYASSLGPSRTLSIPYPGSLSSGLSIHTYTDTFSNDTENDPTENWLRDRTPSLMLQGSSLLRDDILAAFFDVFPLGDVQCLVLPDPKPLAAHIGWQGYGIFEHIPTVVELRLVDWHISKDDASAVHKTLGLQTGLDGSHYLELPNLSTLTLEATEFHEHPELRKAAFVDTLRDISRERYENSMAIKHLRILERRSTSPGEVKLEEADIRLLAEAGHIGEVTFVGGAPVRGTSEDSWDVDGDSDDDTTDRAHENPDY